MDIKEAISILNNNKHETLWRAKVPKIQNKNMDKIIMLLKRGEKYRIMYRNLINTHNIDEDILKANEKLAKDEVIK